MTDDWYPNQISHMQLGIVQILVLLAYLMYLYTRFLVLIQSI